MDTDLERLAVADADLDKTDAQRSLATKGCRDAYELD
jgi:hypothetical protein